MREQDIPAFFVQFVKVPYASMHNDVTPYNLPFNDDGELFGIPHENTAGSNTPHIRECRFAVLSLAKGYVVYDRLLSRIVDGVYTDVNNALGVTELYNKGIGHKDMSPNGDALGLRYPKVRKSHDDLP
jgi:hypothetical protein